MSDKPVRATHPLAELREILAEARTSDDVERVHAALIDVVDGLITHAEKQERLLQDLQSDMGHKQGIVTRIGGGDYTGDQDNKGPGGPSVLE